MCKKEPFKLSQALYILRNIFRKKKYRREKRAYYCNKCNAWHLTSQEEAQQIDFQPLEEFKKYIKQTNEENSGVAANNN